MAWGVHAVRVAHYVAELFRRVLFPTTRGADLASVLVTLGLAAFAFFAGVKVSEDTTIQVLAYVGAIRSAPREPTTT